MSFCSQRIEGRIGRFREAKISVSYTPHKAGGATFELRAQFKNQVIDFSAKRKKQHTKQTKFAIKYII